MRYLLLLCLAGCTVSQAAKPEPLDPDPFANITVPDEPKVIDDIGAPKAGPVKVHVYGPDWCPVCKKVPNSDRFIKHKEPFPQWVYERANKGYPVLHWEVGGKWYADHGWRGEEYLDSRIAMVSTAQAPTPHSKIAEGLEAAGLKPGQSFLDIGCGDGRALIVAVEQFKASKATGIEIDSNQAAEARKRVAAAGLSDKITIIEGDGTKVTLPKADVAYVYLYPDVLEKLKLEKFPTVVSYMHQVPGMTMRKSGDFYVFTGGVAAAPNGWTQVYVRPWQTPGRECGNRSCVMCYGGYQWRRTAQAASYCPTCRR